MTRSSDLKKLVRARMESTGENYTAARAALLARDATDPDRLTVDAPASAGAPVPADTSASADAQAPDPRAARARHEKLIRPFLRDGHLLSIPAKRKTRLAVLLELLARFAPGESYTEAQVGDILRPIHEDVAFLRRELVDYGYLERDGVGTYWTAQELPLREGNMAQEVTDWEAVWLPRFLDGQIGRIGESADLSS
ncbi:hypothetical protein DEO23_08185 [Brachybacterium endophyticum]|uniref:DUF2087 domain-containing protein n=1 Tax=Brachybacterium endophyticum TaxID=2182385 RepID=A0A2U2RLX1_9MICO|nr:DUF2087 domain-containing protein [Brachybacterium endophyticum]PWH06868.1 hypothetical protein DEO23_08185 [Brachybacterium endophyticum]